MSEHVIISTGVYKGYHALVENVNNNKVKLDITFETFFLSKNDKNIKIISDNKLLLSLNLFTNIDFNIKVSDNDIIKNLNVNNDDILKLSEDKWIIKKLFTQQQKSKIQEYGFSIIKEENNVSFLEIKNLVLNYITGPNDTVQISSFNATIKLNSSYAEQIQNKTLKMFFYPFFFKESDIIDNKSIDQINMELENYNSKRPKKEQITFFQYIERFTNKNPINKKNNQFMIINGSLKGKFATLNTVIDKSLYHLYSIDNPDNLIPVSLDTPIVIGNNTQIQNNFWQIKINKIYPLVSLRLETENKIVSVYRDEFKNTKEIKQLENSLKNLNLSQKSSIKKSISEELLLVDNNDPFEFQIAETDIDEELEMEEQYEKQVFESEEKQMQQEIEQISDEIEEMEMSEDLEEDKDISQEAEYQLGFKEKDQFTENKELTSAEKGILDIIKQNISIFKVKVENIMTLFNIVNKERQNRQGQSFDLNNFIYATILFFSDKKEVPKNKKIKSNKALIEQYLTYLKTNFNPQTNPENYMLLQISQNLKPIKEVQKVSYYYSNVWRTNKVKYIQFDKTENRTSRLEAEYFNIFDEQSKRELAYDYLIKLKEDSVFDEQILFQTEFYLKKGKKSEDIINILADLGLDKKTLEKYLLDFLKENEYVQEFNSNSKNIILKILNFIGENTVIEANNSIPVYLLLNRFNSQNNIQLSFQSFCNIVNNLELKNINKVEIINDKIINLKIKDYFSNSDTQTKDLIELKITEVKYKENTDSYLFNQKEENILKNYIQNELIFSEEQKEKIDLYEMYKRFFKYYKISILETQIVNSQNEELKSLTQILNFVRDPLNSPKVDKRLIPYFGSFQRLKELLNHLGYGKFVKDNYLLGFGFKNEEFNPENFYSNKLKAQKEIQKELDALYEQFMKDVEPYIAKKKKLKTMMPTIDDFYSIAFLARISDRETLNLIMGYSTEKIIEILTQRYATLSFDNLDAYIANLIKKGKEKTKDKNKNSLINFIEDEKEKNIEILEPELFDNIYSFISNIPYKVKKVNDIMSNGKREYYMQPIMKNFPKEIAALNNIKNLYIDKIVKKVKELEEKGYLIIVQDVELQVLDVSLDDKKDKITKKINEYFPRKFARSIINTPKFNFQLLSRLYKINYNLSSLIIKELEDKFIDIYLEKDVQEYNFEYVISLYNKYKNTLSNKYIAHVNLISFIESILKYFFTNTLDIKIKIEIEAVYEKLLFFYKLGQTLEEFDFQRYVKNITNLYYGVVYKDAKELLVKIFFEKDINFDIWVEEINEQLKKEGKPTWNTKSNIIISNYYKIFNFFQILYKKIKKEDIFAILNKEEKIKCLLKYNIKFDLGEVLKPFVNTDLSFFDIKNILIKIKENENMIVPNYKTFFSQNRELGIKIEETINTVQTKKQIMEIKLFNIVYIINDFSEDERLYMLIPSKIVFWRGTDENELKRVWSLYYKTLDIMKSLSLFKYDETKDNYIAQIIMFFLSIPAFNIDQINTLTVIPKRYNIGKSATTEERITLSEKSKQSLTNWILENGESSKKRKIDKSEIEDLEKRLRSSTIG